MDWVTLSRTAMEYLKKYRYIAIVLLAGIFLLLIPHPQEEKPVPLPDETTGKEDLSRELEEILSQIQGAGKVKVLLTYASGPETIYQVNEDIPGAGSDSNIRRDTVIVTDGQREQTGLVRRQTAPQYLGAIVLCQGADSASIRLSIVEAVGNATGLPSNCISVLKMK